MAQQKLQMIKNLPVKKCSWCGNSGIIINNQLNCNCGYISEFCPVHTNWIIWVKNKKIREETFLDGAHGDICTRRALERRNNPRFK